MNHSLSSRHWHKMTIEIVLECLETLQCCANTGWITIERKIDSLGTLLQEASMFTGECGPKRRNNIFEAILVSNNHINIAFDDYSCILVTDGITRKIHAIEDSAFVE